MNVKGKHYRTIWLNKDQHSGNEVISVIDQRLLPHSFVIVDLKSFHEILAAISDMVVRGAPLIGAAAAWAMYMAAKEGRNSAALDQHLDNCAHLLHKARPTAVNLAWAIESQQHVLKKCHGEEEILAALKENAETICHQEVEICQSIGTFGLALIKSIHRKNPKRPVQILTHCNAGWLATVDWGMATGPIYEAFSENIPVHVWVDETRPRNQGASLTAWELAEHGVPYTLITDNAGGHLMQTGQVDIVFVGTDRTTRKGDVANKIGTYLKALAAFDNNVPFYVCAPSSSIDWNMESACEMKIEERSAEEVKYITGLANGQLETVLIAPADAQVSNFGFDITPSRLITGIITERGIAQANEESLLALFPEKRKKPVPK